MNQHLPEIGARLLAWFDLHGRKELPWQKDINPYRVWVSEIMLQQTQVATVIPYYLRFMEQLPSVGELAQADEDTVLHLWTGLGYYARARNLHRAAKMVVSDFGGEFPSEQEQLEALPGIGRSTAGAIRAIAFRQPASILDGNVKRVLARYHAIEGWPGQTAILKQLWLTSEYHTPQQRIADYTQAIMDLGASLCSRSRPQCEQCPLKADCIANAQSNQGNYPGKKPRKKLPVRQTRMLILQNPAGEVLLEKRPPQGIWGGLWSLPQLELDEEPANWLEHQFGLAPQQLSDGAQIRHTFSHFHLDITPTIVQLEHGPAVAERQQVWYNLRQPAALGLAAPVKSLLDQLAANHSLLEDSPS